MIREALKKDSSLCLSMMCRYAEVSRSGYYAFLKNEEPRKTRDFNSLRVIRHHFEKSRRKAGIVTLDMILRRNGHIFNHKKIARIKSQYGLHTKIRRRNPYRGMSTSAKVHDLIPNILNRNFVQPPRISELMKLFPTI